MTPLQQNLDLVRRADDAENEVAVLQEKLAKFRVAAETLLRAYENKTLIPPDRIGSQWDELKKLLEKES